MKKEKLRVNYALQAKRVYRLRCDTIRVQVPQLDLWMLSIFLKQIAVMAGITTGIIGL
tara:strand:- start:387 stop:560 length:174 start_codon:yes stop_codon:yes gene_type:complete